MAIWAISASPLIMGNDLRQIPLSVSFFLFVLSLSLSLAVSLYHLSLLYIYIYIGNVSASSQAILLNKFAIAVSQDSLGQMGTFH